MVRPGHALTGAKSVTRPVAGSAGTPAKISACKMRPLQKKSIVVISINNASRAREDVLNHREYPVSIKKRRTRAWILQSLNRGPGAPANVIKSSRFMQ